MDGVDAALIETDGTPSLLHELDFASHVYDPRFSLLLKATEFAVRHCNGDLTKVKSGFIDWLHLFCNTRCIEASTILSYFPESSSIGYDDIARHSTILHIQVIRQLLQKSKQCAEDIDVVGYHGQTMFHQPQTKCSIMMGDPQYMADQLGIRVIYDFRRNDIEAGGQGAPFAPLYHQALAVRDNRMPLAVVNCGGISNITLINSPEETDVIGFDTGPGNALIDSLVRSRTNGLQQMDINGEYGSRGRVNESVIQALYEKAILRDNQNYFSQCPPKSLDYGDMQLIPELEALSIEDACATLEAFTADTIVSSLTLIDAPVPPVWILAGGGWKNPVICNELVVRLHQRYGKHIHVMTANEAGWNGQALEAQIFAYFAVRSLLNKPLSVPGTTRVPYPLSGGVLFSR